MKKAECSFIGSNNIWALKGYGPNNSGLEYCAFMKNKNKRPNEMECKMA